MANPRSARYGALRAARAWMIKTLEVLVFALFVSFTVIMLVAIFNRFVLNESIVEAEELVRYCLVWMTLLAAPLVTAEGSHLNGSLMSFIRFPVASLIEKFAIKIGIVAFAACLSYSTWLLIDQTISRTPALGIGLGFVYAALLFGALIDIFVVVVDTILGIQHDQKMEYME